MQVVERLEAVDNVVSGTVQTAVLSNGFTRNLVYYGGLLPYELYVLPGYFVSMLLAVWLEEVAPVRFHILPHLLSFSVFLSLKHAVDRQRPGCTVQEELRMIDPGHCKGKTEYQSFPSGHTGISFALATALGLEMLVPKNPKLFGLDVSKEARIPITVTGAVVASLTSLQRVAGGYHYVGDVTIGAVLGMIIGYVSWNMLATLDEDGMLEDSKFKLELPAKILVSLPFAFMLFSFLKDDVWKLTAVQH